MVALDSVNSANVSQHYLQMQKSDGCLAMLSMCQRIPVGGEEICEHSWTLFLNVFPCITRLDILRLSEQKLELGSQTVRNWT